MIEWKHTAEFSRRKGNFLKGVRFSPEGTCVLAASDDRTLRLFVLPQEAYDLAREAKKQPTELASSALTVREGEGVRDFAWYPRMALGDTATACFVSVSKDHPIHLWDAFTGALRGSYIPHNHLGELVSAVSVAFSSDGSRIFCGFDGAVRTFDAARPGSECTVLSTRDALFPGIVGTLSSSPDGKLLAAGSYAAGQGTAVFSVSDCSRVCVLGAHKGGVTRALFSLDGRLLATGARKDSHVFVWDIRNTAAPAFTMQRRSPTSQHIDIDFTPDSRFLLSGSQDGALFFLSLADGRIALQLPPSVHQGDTVNSVSVHPYLPFVATGTGQRRYAPPLTSRIDCGDSSSGGSDEEEDRPEQTPPPPPSLCILRMPSIS